MASNDPDSLSPSFHGPRVQAQVSGVLCSESRVAEVKVVAGSSFKFMWMLEEWSSSGAARGGGYSSLLEVALRSWLCVASVFKASNGHLLAYQNPSSFESLSLQGKPSAFEELS